MQITSAAWENYINKLAAINQKAAELMQTWIDTNGYDKVEELIYYANSLTQKYGEAAAALACVMYDAIADASGVVTAAAVPAEVFPASYVSSAVRAKLDTSPRQIPALVSRMVKQAGADTALQNAQRDGAQFAWIPHGDTCPFCIALASRGWQYMSKKAMKNGHAEHIHANCDCTYAVRFDSKSGVAGYDPQKYADIYYSADGDTPRERVNALRRIQRAQNRDAINARKRELYAENSGKPFTIQNTHDIIYSAKYIMPRNKIEGFLLKPGAKHANEFFSIGYTPQDIERLNSDIEAQFNMADAFDFRELNSGVQRFSISMRLGVDKLKPFRTVWQVDPGAEQPRFITAHREDE